MLFEIKSRFSGSVLFSVGAKSLRLAVEVAVKKKISLRDANLYGADLRGANLRDAYLRGAYLCGAYLRGADLDGADLRDADLRGADLRGAYLRGADLRDAYLSGAYLSGADLCGAYLRDAYLSGANLRGVPQVENIDAKILEAIESGKAKGLDMSNWHGQECTEENWCQTTHCRAGYAVAMAGKAGFDMENRIGTSAAATLIYLKSTPDEPIPDFYATNEEAMKDIRARAARQTGGTHVQR